MSNESPSANPQHSNARAVRRTVTSVVCLLLLSSLAAGCWFWSGSEKQRKLDVTIASTTSSHTELTGPLEKTSGYVGPEACAACHRERVAEFIQTKHFLACREPQADKMPRAFLTEQGRVPSREPQIEFEMTQTQEGFFQTAIRSTSGGVRSSTSRIDLQYGSPPNDEVYFSWKGDFLYELPVAWLHPQQEWGISTFNPDSGGDFSRPMSVRCLECHTTWMEHLPGTQNGFKRDHAILGVTCERCHGPAQPHVDFHRMHPDEQSGAEILHPGRLSRERLIEVCTQCHSNAIKHRGPAYSYRPGQLLDESYKTTSSRYPEENHVANQIQSLRESKCFQQSDSMTCITCHDPHHSSAAAPEIEAQASHSCTTCHQETACHARPQLPTGVQHQCVACHMPAHRKIQVYFDTTKDTYVAPVMAYEHQIRIDPMATQTVLWEWHKKQPGDENALLAKSLANSLYQHWNDEGDRRRQNSRHLAAADAYREALRFQSDPDVESKLKAVLADRSTIDVQSMVAARQIRQQQYRDAAITLEKILLLKPDQAQAHGKLGAVYATLGQKTRAVEHLEAVRQCDPDDAYGEGMLGWLAYNDGQYASAIEHYQQADEMEPFKAKLHFQWGLACMKMESWKSASDQFRLAVTIDPRHADASDALSQSLQKQGDFDGAIQSARRAVMLTERKRPEFLLQLAESLADNRQLAEAQQVAVESLNVTRPNDAELMLRIRRRLQEYQK